MPYASLLDVYKWTLRHYLQWADEIKIKYGCPLDRPFDQYELTDEDYIKLKKFYVTLEAMEKRLELTPANVKQIEAIITKEEHGCNSVVS